MWFSARHAIVRAHPQQQRWVAKGEANKTYCVREDVKGVRRVGRQVSGEGEVLKRAKRLDFKWCSLLWQRCMFVFVNKEIQRGPPASNRFHILPLSLGYLTSNIRIRTHVSIMYLPCIHCALHSSPSGYYSNCLSFHGATFRGVFGPFHDRVRSFHHQRPASFLF